MDDITERLLQISKLQQKAVVFSYKLKPLKLLSERLTEANVGWVSLDGRMSALERSDAILRFRNQPDSVALLASSRVASEGLTLTEANHAFFVNRWWNPSNTDQARDRIVRIGQTRSVFVHSYVCDGTVEQRLEQILESKRELVDKVIGSLASGVGTSPDVADLLDVLRPP
ncbi:hypothetical protein AU196_22440 [Mycobacterium sp. IS-1742]|nr:hypothetical protein AU196_22440 [Mycobacterium sp. IS-1742]